MSPSTQSSHGIDTYLAEFDRLAAAAPDDPAWFRSLRRSGIDRFADLGFPTTRDEEWRFTSVRPIADRTYAPARAVRVAPSAELPADWDAGGCRLVFVNGFHDPDRSGGQLPPGVQVCSLRTALHANPGIVQDHLGRFASSGHAFTSLNTGLIQDGAFVWIAPGVIVERPIVLVFLSVGADAASVSHPRVLILAGNQSQASIVEAYQGPADHDYFTNAVTEVTVGTNAVLDHYKLQRESRRANHVGGMYVHLSRDAAFTAHSVALGGTLVRNDLVAVLDGEGADCTLNGLYVAGGDRLVDNHTTIDHAVPHCGSHELYKGVLSGHAHAVFNGKIIVRPGAQKTDAKQTNKALLLSDHAQINTKPQLEIFANDVKCTHGAAVGQLDEDAVFYLRSRGLDFQQARDMLIHAFVGDVLGRIRLESLRRALEQELGAALRTARAVGEITARDGERRFDQ